MQLSDEDCGLIRKMANEVSAPNWQLPRKLMQAAFALGVERAHKVKPLVWYPNGSGAYFWALGELYIVRALTNGEYSASYAGIDDLDGDFQTEHEAKTACQKHHEAFVLSQLEQL
jgi:hypothetical protein